jgi:hypothetical protein
VIDPSIRDENFARDFLGGVSRKVARRRIIEAGIPYQKDHGHFLIKLSDALNWREARLKTPEAPTIKRLLDEIADEVLAKRKGVGETTPGLKRVRDGERNEPSTS